MSHNEAITKSPFFPFLIYLLPLLQTQPCSGSVSVDYATSQMISSAPSLEEVPAAQKAEIPGSSWSQAWNLLWLNHRIPEFSELSITSAPGWGKGEEAGPLANRKRLSEAEKKAFLQPIRQITLKGKHISQLKPASIQHFPISSKSTVTDVGQNVLHPLEVLVSMVRISLISWMSLMLCVLGGVGFFPLERRDF